MAEKEQITFSVRLSTEEAELIDRSASEAGLTRSEYVRAMLFTSTADLREAVMYATLLANQIHSALYSIAEKQGQVRRFLTTQELREINNAVRLDTLQYAIDMPEHLGELRAELQAASAAKTGTKA